MKGGFFLLNGQFYKENEPVFTLADFDDRIGGFSEYFRAEHNEVLFPESIAAHLLASGWSIDLDLTGLLDTEGRILRKDVSRLLNKNHLYHAAKIEIQIYPGANKPNILLRASEIEKGYFAVKEPGLLISFYRDQLKDIQPNGCFAASGQYLQQACIRTAREQNRPNMLLLNRDGYVCESIGGSFAFAVNRTVFFVAENSGGYRCALKEEVIRSVKEAGFEPADKEDISPDDLLQAEELFLFDACNGIQKVLGLEDRRYFSTKTSLIAEKLTFLARLDRQGKEQA